MKVKTVAVIVSRNGSTRVPKKALLDISGQPLIAHMFRIAKKIKGIDSIWLATTTLAEDDTLVYLANIHQINVFRGDPDKVLDRIHGVATVSNADTIVYIGGDCPLLDPNIISESIQYFYNNDIDYLCNYEPPTYPGGMDINIISFDALDKAFRLAIAPSQRIHAFSYLTFHQQDFKIENIALNEDLSSYHWSIDYPEDIKFVRYIYDELFEEKSDICINDVIQVLKSNSNINNYHSSLLKPKVTHAFFSSPGMMIDITQDINYLNERAKQAIVARLYEVAEEAYKEISSITLKLCRMQRN